MLRAERFEREKPFDRAAIVAREPGAEFREHARRDAARPVVADDEARARRDQHEAAHGRRLIERGAHRDQAAERPAEPDRARHDAGDAARALGGIETRAVVVAEAVSRQIDEMQAEMRRQRARQRREDAGVHRPAVDQHEILAAALRLDVHQASAVASAASKRSTSLSECSAVSAMRSRALPSGTVGGRIAGT